MDKQFTVGEKEINLSGQSLIFIGAGALIVLVVVFSIGVVVGKGLGKIQNGEPLAEYEVASVDALAIDQEGSTAGADVPAGDQEMQNQIVEKDGVTYAFYDDKQGAPTNIPEEPPLADQPPEVELPQPEPPIIIPPPPVQPPAQARPPVPAPQVNNNKKQLYYTVQVAAFNNPAEAKRLQDRLKAKGQPAYIVEANIKGTVWHRVRVGKFADKPGAEAMAAAIEEKEGLKPFIDVIAQ